MDRRSFLLSSSALAAVALPWRTASAAAAPWRTFEVVSRVEIVQPQGVSRAWVPLPFAEASDWHRPLGSTWGGNAARALAMTEDKYGVRMVYAESSFRRRRATRRCRRPSSASTPRRPS
jgi:hypothetical protein